MPAVAENTKPANIIPIGPGHATLPPADTVVDIAQSADFKVKAVTDMPCRPPAITLVLTSSMISSLVLPLASSAIKLFLISVKSFITSLRDGAPFY